MGDTRRCPNTRSECQQQKTELIHLLSAAQEDRDEWKRQHENLLSVRQSDLQIIEPLRERITRLEAEIAELRAKLDEKPVSSWSCRVLTDGNSWPIGTNLLTADQAKEMFRYVLADTQQAARLTAQKDWQWVPKEPTDEMKQAADREFGLRKIPSIACICWDAMLKSAPQKGEAESVCEMALNVKHPDCHKAADAFWQYWRENGETHKHGYYESTWGAINKAIRMVGVVKHNYEPSATKEQP